MIKYIKSRISIKIFLLTMLILMGVSGISYGFVAAFMPKSYSDSLNRSLAAKAKQLAESMSAYSMKNAMSLMEEFSIANQSRVVLLNENGEMVQEWNGYEETVSEEGIVFENPVLEVGTTSDYIQDINAAVIDRVGTVSDAIAMDSEESVTSEEPVTSEGTVISEKSVTSVETQMEQQAMGHYQVHFKGSEKIYTLFIFGSTQLVNQAVAALGQIFPWMLLTVFFLSLVIALFYSKYLSKPVEALSAASGKMADLDFTVRTDMKRTDEIGTLSRSLDVMVKKLDSALTGLQSANEKLKDEMEQEREQEQRRMEFFAAASHELKTPVTILKGQIQGMEQNVGVYKDRDKYLARAGEVTVTLQNMIQEILMISKMESCGFSIKKTKVDLAELTRLQLAELNELFERKSMSLEVNMPDKCVCEGDKQLMGIVTRNILVNALRYSPEGESIKVKLYTKVSPLGARSGRENTVHIIWEVENTGVWLDEREVPRLFDAFYRVDSSRNRKSGGSGLGLYIVREILEQHEAAYEIKNTKNGVCFKIILTEGERECQPQ